MPHIGNFPPPGYPKPLAISCAAFHPFTDTYDWEIGSQFIRNRIALTEQDYYAGVDLPHKAVVTELTLIGHREDALATLMLQLWKAAHDGITTLMAELTADWTDGNGLISTTTITEPTIDNENYQYSVMVRLDPNDSINDVMLRKVKIDWK